MPLDLKSFLELLLSDCFLQVALTGAVCCVSAGGVRGIARGGMAGLTLTGLYALYNNWEHMKGSLARQSL